jgi:hypothetical protein
MGLPPIDQAMDCLRHDGPIERNASPAKQLLCNWHSGNQPLR